jgi:hypothetical protein
MDNPTVQTEPSTKRVKLDSNELSDSEHGSDGSESESDASEGQTPQSVQSSEAQGVSLTTHQDNSPNRPKTSSSNNDKENDVQEKMVLFLTGKPSGARSRYAKAFKFPSKVSDSFQVNSKKRECLKITPYVSTVIFVLENLSQLFYVLECGDYNDVISWTPDGNSFTVHDPEAFTAKVPAAVLREAKFSSFHRKVKYAIFRLQRI